MSQSDLAERARESLRRGAVLKMRLSLLRSRRPDDPILVFEGVDDVGPFAAWIDRLFRDAAYSPLPGAGKAQVLELVQLLRGDRTGLSKEVYCFVDRDFDDTRGVALGDDLFCTDSYSVENHLVSPRVLRSILLDELRCPVDDSDDAAIIQMFLVVLDQFLSEMTEPNTRLFLSKVCGIPCRLRSESIGDYVSVTLTSVCAAPGRNVSALVELDSEPEITPAIRRLLESHSACDRHMRCRGKFLHKFFLKWLSLLADERQSNSAGLFRSCVKLSFSEAKLTPRLLASRSEMPAGLAQFLTRIFSRSPIGGVPAPAAA